MNDREILEGLVKQGNRWRATPIVDDDFVGLKNEFDNALRVATDHVKKPRRTVVCLCGSTRFMNEFYDANMRETLAGNIVLTVGMSSHGDCQPTKEQKIALDQLHFDKIDMADEVLILNVGGYVGSSTNNEIKHAYEKGKRIRWLEPDNIPYFYVEVLGIKDQGE